MKRKSRIEFYMTALLFFIFLIFTVMARKFDVKPIGPEGAMVGFSELNRLAHSYFGVNLFWYHLTDWLGLAAVLYACAFALLGIYQLVKQRSLRRVDRDILMLGIFYLVLIGCYLIFEEMVINNRPILMEGNLEASYLSSHTMVVVSIMATSIMQFRHRIKKRGLLLWTADLISLLIAAVTVGGRLVSGVHWLTDIAGGLLLSAALVMLYHSANSLPN